MRRLNERRLRTTLRTISLSIVVAFGILSPATTWAQGAPAARDFMNTPVDAASFFADFLFNKAETGSSSNVPVPNNETLSRIRAVTLLWSFPMFGRYAGVQIGGGYTDVQGTGPFGEIRGSGFTDPAFTFHMNFFGAPALRKAEFSQAIPKSYSSFHMTVNAPLGSYDRNIPVNTGSNRWAFNPVFNLDLTPDKGVSYFDLYAGARYFTNNNEYQGNGQLSQKPIGNFAVHYSHNIGRKMFAASGIYYNIGGATSVNGVSQNNGLNGFRPGFAISRLIWKFRWTVRYELTPSTPHSAPTNAVFSIRVSGFLF